MPKLKAHQSNQQQLFEMEAKHSLNTKSDISFPIDYDSILHRIASINPVKYSRSRNFINGAVTYLSPYIARGVVSLPMIKTAILNNHKFYEAEKLIQELAWREYFQRVWQHHNTNIFTDLKQPQQAVVHHQIPTAILNASSNIEGIDKAISTLYETGYMHNHCRMYTAMLTCNIAKSHWQLPSQWLYYHLLDGDLSSNALSWQWVAGSFSSKKYVANQENINKYCYTNQQKTYLDVSYETLANMPVPEILQPSMPISLSTTLPDVVNIELDSSLPLIIYNSYNLDPLWHNAENANRVLLLEPSHFKQYPISEKVMQFIIGLATTNIKAIKIFVGEYDELLQAWGGNKTQAFAKEHPTTKHYNCTIEERDWLFPEVNGYFPSFFAYWKKAERYCK
jgi:deoxyribodipyrimidine photo-lyase